ncbi:F-box domain, cyclin-like protein [Cynara cardunculus var. scolymus]|uniref:F-box domain, cyclin-like protein n=1 Tax=Cynara cardunculus var. scolymus TaxID=59895 RepID=A0A124SHQ2_CYNCS|nr:F-box domain, cyclin-like protein [Cynara cardunculus var. scolymus]
MDHKKGTTASAIVGGYSLLERIPESILNEIFSRLEPETLTTLCSVACVSRTLNSSVNKLLSSFSSVDLSAFSVDSQTFDGIIRRFRKIEKITLDCLRLNDSSIRSFLGPDVEELILLKCSSLSYRLLSSIGRTCPNLRVLTLEFSGFIDKSAVFDLKLEDSLGSCRFLESLRIKVRGGEINEYGFMLLGIYHLLPQTVKILKLQPASVLDTVIYLRTFNYTNLGILIAPASFGQTLTHLSLVLDCITDVLLRSIAHSLPLLAELDLKDRPTSEPSDDLSDVGIQSLVGCHHLTSLSLVRSRQHFATSFKRTTDMGMFLLSEGCKGLESIRLGGFSKVSDAGFTSILNSCFNLKKFEIQYASLLTDLAFQDISKAPRSLTDIKLVSCSYITSEAVRELASCSDLEILNLLGCRSVADSCLTNVSRLKFLTTLNLGGADVTDNGMSVLGNGNAPISTLSLRGCKRVTDKGIAFLFRNEGKIRKSLSSLDLGHMPGITDDGIRTVVDGSLGLVDLCIRNCFHVTDASVEALGLKGRRFESEKSKVLRRIDVYNCSGLSIESLRLLKKPLFCGLQWIGIGRTRLICGDVGLDEIQKERKWI